ncbi:hypothetical protein, partial [Cardiobacterium hominis]|uniref:hypothetical protein n=1 Tax=Cardiobacterium hominis TaxID=2718 RepID=UPI0028E4292B
MNKGIGVSWEPIAAAGGARRVKVCLFNREVCHLTPPQPSAGSHEKCWRIFRGCPPTGGGGFPWFFRLLFATPTTRTSIYGELSNQVQHFIKIHFI